MDALPIDDLLQWLQDVIERRWGKFWAWTIFALLLVLMVGAAIWFVSR